MLPLHRLQKKVTFLFMISLFLGSTSLVAQSFADKEIKHNVQDIDDAVQLLLQLRPITFEYNTTHFKQLKLKEGKQYGFLSENVQRTFPELIEKKNINYMFGKNSYRNASIPKINENQLIPVLVASILELQDQIYDLRKEILDLKTQKAVTERK
jgi:hypothetical protein